MTTDEMLQWFEQRNIEVLLSYAKYYSPLGNWWCKIENRDKTFGIDLKIDKHGNTPNHVLTLVYEQYNQIVDALPREMTGLALTYDPPGNPKEIPF